MWAALDPFLEDPEIPLPTTWKPLKATGIAN